jgi:transcriptional regulator with XRE-family HTH domain
MSVLERLEEIREDHKLKRSQFEKVLSKSTGYINTLFKNNSMPGIDVLIKIMENYPEYNLVWILTGEGEKLKANAEKSLRKLKHGEYNGQNFTLLDVRDDLKREMQKNMGEINSNFNVLHEGIFELLKEQQEVLKFTSKLNPVTVAKLVDKMAEDHKLK